MQRERGFTLIELVTVISIISILVAVGLPQYRVAIIQAKEAVLREDLYRCRDLIDQYYADKGKYPASLQALLDDGYLRQVPKDPMTGATDWEEVPDPNPPDTPGAAAETGIVDIHSASKATGLDGTAYNEW